MTKCILSSTPLEVEEKTNQIPPSRLPEIETVHTLKGAIILNKNLLVHSGTVRIMEFGLVESLNKDQ